ncbi:MULTISPECIES: hypothetical protein [Burkholderiaceae]|nr:MULTISPECIES: hypothetical protein [Burkholderiaceae]AME27168.1 hypothetical protein AXG89_24960 [Burkholderia sp. PAMC 26561]AME27683.1 hypothetical protein AXG89_27735 [Burkholderia sp. PAMC 26561]
MLRKMEVDGYEIAVTASEVLRPMQSSTAIEGYRVAAVISRNDGGGVVGHFLCDVIAQGEVHLTLDAALDYGEREARARIASGFTDQV